MLINSKEIVHGKLIEADICIIGAGVAGLCFAKEFANSKYRICLVESGGIKSDRETQSLYWGKKTGLPYYELDKARARYLGGTSHYWHIPIGDNELGVRLRGLDPIDFEKRDWVPYSGWPFDASYMKTYYERAHKACFIGPYSYEPEDWISSNGSDSSHLTSKNLKTTIFQFADKKSFIRKHLAEIEKSKNITILLHANCVNIAAHESGEWIKELNCACLKGPKFNIQAKVYILAAGGIETPRLLLLSNKIHKTGLGNQHDLVGRFFMEHPHLWSGTFIPATIKIARNMDLYRIHRVRGISVMGNLALKDKTLRKENLLNYTVSIHPSYKSSKKWYLSQKHDSHRSVKLFAKALTKYKLPEDLALHSLKIIKNIPQLTQESLRLVTNKYFKEYVDGKHVIVYKLNHMAEQSPNPNSRVILDQEKDALDLNRSILHWQLTSQDIQSIIRSQEIINEELIKLGAGSLNIEMKSTRPPETLHGGWHHMGTTRMHVNPRQGVVDENCKIHGIINLFVAGASVFPTSGYANPVLTTVALTLRLADHVAKILN